jgi:uncharacterized protein
MNKTKNIVFLLIVLFLLPAAYRLSAQDIPERPNPPKLVSDFAGVLSGDEAGRLEEKLVRFNDSTSTQITVVIVKSLNGYDKNDFAQRLGEKWGVGQKGKNNGVVILVKPKYPTEKGEACIQTGYGMEGVLPDITCKRIVDNEMVANFKEGKYFAGIDAAVSTIISISRHEYSADQYNKRTAGKQKPYGVLVPILIIAILFMWIRSGRGGGMHSVGKNLPFWATMFMLGSMGRGSGGNWGDFRSGGGGFGGGGGGFGGFGGGSFGGGGAGGSW